MYGFNQTTALGRINHELLRTEFRPPLESIQAKVLSQDHWEGELVQQGASGQALTVSSRWAVVRDACRVPQGILEINSDITAHKQAEDARHQLLHRLVTVQEEERKRISRELHDQIGQNLTALLMGLKALPQSVDGVHSERLAHLQHLTQSMMEQVHRLAWELRPASLDNIGLEATLRQYIDDWTRASGIASEFILRGSQSHRRLSNVLETMIYRVVQEALTNVRRHANATKVDVIIKHGKSEVHAMIEDNGQGFDPGASETLPAPCADRLGLVGMRERVDLLGGTLSIESSSKGTTLVVRVPIEAGRHELGNAKSAMLNGEQPKAP
jgi:signal transduction histidine kinase